MQCVQLIRGQSHDLHARWNRSRKIRVDQIAVVDGALKSAGRLQEHEPPRAELSRHPRRNAVAGDVPRMRKRIDSAQPVEWGQNWHLSRVEGGADGRPIRDERAFCQAVGDEMRILIHRQHRHPMRRVIGQLTPAVDLAHDVGKWTAARHDEQSSSARRSAHRCEHGIEVIGVRKQRAANLHDDLHHQSNLNSKI